MLGDYLTLVYESKVDHLHLLVYFWVHTSLSSH